MKNTIIQKWQNAPIRFLQGVAVGLGGILPGISGGTLCAAFGIHQMLTECISQPKEKLLLYFRELVFFVLGGAVGFIGLAKGSAVLYGLFPAEFTCAFAGLLLGTYPALWQSAGAQGRSKKGLISLLISFFALSLFFILGNSSLQITLQPNGLGFLVCGILWGLGIILPGLSASTAILFIGLYQPMLEGIGKLNPSVLIPLGAGAFLCVLFMGKAVALGYQKHYEILSHGVLGAISATTVMLILSAERMCIEWLSIGFLLTCPKKIKRKPAKADFQKFIRKDVTCPKGR
jgi:putative membrane protein